MLYSAQHRVGYVHYPKTAGHSVSLWFKRSFPDAVYLDPPSRHNVSHLGVKPSLSLLCALNTKAISSLRIIAVMREPLSMMISLYKYWKTYKFSKSDDELPLLIQFARNKTFAEFVDLAVDGSNIETYESFFDFGGPVWPETRIAAFESLESGVFRIIKEMDLVSDKVLSRLNVGPSSHESVRSISCHTVTKLKKYFAWYYETGQHVLWH
jgi:hypothetical protein